MFQLQKRLAKWCQRFVKMAFKNSVFCHKSSKFVHFRPYGSVQISPACGPNTYQIILVHLWTYGVSICNGGTEEFWWQIYIIQQNCFFPIGHFMLPTGHQLTITDTDIHSLKWSLSSLLFLSNSLIVWSSSDIFSISLSPRSHLLSAIVADMSANLVSCLGYICICFRPETFETWHSSSFWYIPLSMQIRFVLVTDITTV